jgi:hypothetical protein
MNAESLKAAIELMPPEVRSELERMRSAERGLFGNTTTQTIVDRHLELLLWFRNEHQADHSDLALLLHLHGISGPDDQPLTVGTMSSAISRAVGASGRAKTQVGSETQVRPESRVAPEHPSPAPAAAPRLARRRIAFGNKANGPGSPTAPAPKQIVLEGLALTPAMDAQVRSAEHPEIRRAEHQARLSLLVPSTQED